MRPKFVHADMTDCRQHPLDKVSVSGDRGRPKLLLRIVPEPLFGKVGKLDIAVQNLPAAAFLLK